MRWAMTRLALLLAASLLVAACASEGLRADSGDCPAGEVCSDKTPTGLLFAGSLFAGELLLADRSVKVTAAGGSQTIQVRLNQAGEPLPGPFTADIEGTGWSLLASDDTQVVVAAAPQASAPGLLRIADPATGELFDAIELEVLPVERVELHPASREITAGDRPWALYSGGRRAVYADLRAAGEVRLADESLAIAGGAKIAWDVAALGAFAPGAVAVEVTTGAGQRFPLEANLVDAIDVIEVDSQPDGPLTAGGMGFFCFRALSGDAIARGASWRFRADGALRVGDDAAVLADNCPLVHADQAGTGTLVAEAAGRSLALTIEVVADGSSARSAPAAPALAVPPTPGLRAGG